MSSTREPSVEQLRAESELNREALASTVGELRDRVGDTASELKTLISPAHIKQEIKNYVREERDSLIESVQRKAKENPLQLAAIGAAVAYPAFGLLRSLPTPLLLIGAGLFLTSKRGQQQAKYLKDNLDDAVRQGTERVSDVASSIGSDLQDRLAGVRYGAEELRDSAASRASAAADQARAGLNDARNTVANTARDVMSAVDDATRGARSAVNDGIRSAQSTLDDTTRSVSAAAGDAARNVKTAFDETTRNARSTFDDTARSVKAAANTIAGQAASAAAGVTAAASDTAGSFANRASEITDRASAFGSNSATTLTSFVKDNPLLVAGIASVVGAFIAASIPASDAENKLFGAGSEKIKDKARKVAAQGVGRVSDIAAEAAGSAAAAAAREGLNAAGVQDALKSVADSVRTVADRGLETALGNSAKPGQQPITERNTL